MIESNAKVIENSLAAGAPIYGIISLVSDTFDVLRTRLDGVELRTEDRAAFSAAMQQVVAGMRAMDKALEKYQ